jgi:hypothetical protein
VSVALKPAHKQRVVSVRGGCVPQVGDESDVETAQYTRPRESSLCPPQCKPGCWMCFRNAENTKDTFAFLTQLPKHANHVRCPSSPRLHSPPHRTLRRPHAWAAAGGILAVLHPSTQRLTIVPQPAHAHPPRIQPSVAYAPPCGRTP